MLTESTSQAAALTVRPVAEDWKSVLDPAYCGLEGSKGENKLDLENLERTFRLHESLFFSCELADGPPPAPSTVELQEHA